MQSATQLVSLFEAYYKKQKFDQRYDVYRAMEYIMTMNGKRIRPLLTLMACELFEGDIKKALAPAMAVEIYHNSTLVHDDIMDKAATRRGNPTVHKLYGTNIAINTGDMMFSLAYRYVGITEKPHMRKLCEMFNKTVVEVIEGQSLDMEYETREKVSEAEYLEMIKGKTSVLLACALQMGAWVADASPKDQQKIYDFGLNLGLSFQIQDDYLDAFGDPKKVGKSPGGDILLNKKTILLLKTIELAKPAQLKQLNQWMIEKDKVKKVEGIKKLMESTGAKKYTEDLMNDYYLKSLKSMKAIKSSEESKKPLLQLANFLRAREK